MTPTEVSSSAILHEGVWATTQPQQGPPSIESCLAHLSFLPAVSSMHVTRGEQKNCGLGAPHRLSFAPLAFETYGTPTRDFLNLFGRELCSRRAELGGFDPSEEAVYRHYCRSRLSSALQAANARQLHHLAADAPAPPTGRGHRSG